MIERMLEEAGFNSETGAKLTITDSLVSNYQNGSTEAEIGSVDDLEAFKNKLFEPKVEENSVSFSSNDSSLLQGTAEVENILSRLQGFS
jgi:hypothetical protein